MHFVLRIVLLPFLPFVADGNIIVSCLGSSFKFDAGQMDPQPRNGSSGDPAGYQGLQRPDIDRGGLRRHEGEEPAASLQPGRAADRAAREQWAGLQSYCAPCSGHRPAREFGRQGAQLPHLPPGSGRLPEAAGDPGLSHRRPSNPDAPRVPEHHLDEGPEGRAQVGLRTGPEEAGPLGRDVVRHLRHREEQGAAPGAVEEPTPAGTQFFGFRGRWERRRQRFVRWLGRCCARRQGHEARQGSVQNPLPAGEVQIGQAEARRAPPLAVREGGRHAPAEASGRAGSTGIGLRQEGQRARVRRRLSRWPVPLAVRQAGPDGRNRRSAVEARAPHPLPGGGSASRGAVVDRAAPSCSGAGHPDYAGAGHQVRSPADGHCDFGQGPQASLADRERARAGTPGGLGPERRRGGGGSEALSRQGPLPVAPHQEADTRGIVELLGQRAGPGPCWRRGEEAERQQEEEGPPRQEEAGRSGGVGASAGVDRLSGLRPPPPAQAEGEPWACLLAQLAVSSLFALGPALLDFARSSNYGMARVFRLSSSQIPPLFDRLHGSELLPVPVKYPIRQQGKSARSTKKKRLYNFRLGAWTAIVLCSLNYMYLNSDGRTLDWRTPSFATHQQIDMVSNLERSLEQFFRSPVCMPTEGKTFDRIFSEMSYGNTTSLLARPLVAADVALPDIGGAACVDVTSVVTSDLLPKILDPSLTLLGQEHLTDFKPPRASVWASNHQWELLVSRMHRIGMVRPIDDGDIYRVNGQRVLSGAFAVPKSDGKQRLICNIGCNSIMTRMSPADADVLAHPCQFVSILLESGEIILVDEEDEVSCFFIYKLPDAWGSLFTLAKPVPASVLGLDGDHQVFVCLTVIPMGWISAVDVLQNIQRNLALIAGADASAEINPLRPLPNLRHGEEGWTNYVDNFLVLRVTGDVQLINKPGEVIQKVRALKQKLKIPLSAAKRCEGAPVGKRLGAMLNGHEGWVGVDQNERQSLALLILRFVLGTGATFLRPGATAATATTRQRLHWLSLVGSATYALQFQRSLFSLFSRVYQVARTNTRDPFAVQTAEEELLLFVFLTPLIQSNLRLPLASWIGSTDASPYGGAGGTAQISSSEAQQLLRAVDFRGAAVRLDGKEVLGRKPTCISFPTRDFEWHVKHSYPWKHAQHINVLETVAYFMFLRWLTRKGIRFTKFIHIFDSIVALSALAKGRSSSCRLNGVLRRIGALQVFSQIFPLVVWTNSSDMPMDYASRRFQPGRPPGGKRR